MFRTLKFKIGFLAVLLVVVVTAVSVFLISDRMQDALRREIELRSETLARDLGDGLMAIFGAPLEQDDCTLNAVRAAVDMRDRLEEFNAERAAKDEGPVRVGIGITSAKPLSATSVPGSVWTTR